MADKKVKVAALSIASNTTLIILKIIAGILSGSVSIISEAIHSGMDLIASLIAFFSVRVSSKPADDDHPYGHGKVENISGVIEGLLIFVAAILIVKEAIQKIIHPGVIEETGIAIGVMLVSSVINFIVSSILYKTAREVDSIALEADALHLKTDVYTSLGVGLGLLLIAITGKTILDPVVAILVACLIVKEAWELVNKSFKPLLDGRLSAEEESLIEEVLDKYSEQIIDYHMLRTRRAGNVKHIDFHMTVNENLTIKDYHDLYERIENDIEKALAHTSVIINAEPGCTCSDE